MKIVKKIFLAAFIVAGFGFCFSSALGVDPPTSITLSHYFTDGQTKTLVRIDWTGTPQYYKVYRDGILLIDYGEPAPGQTDYVAADDPAPSGSHVYTVESVDPVTGDVARLDQSYDVPIPPALVPDPGSTPTIDPCLTLSCQSVINPPTNPLCQIGGQCFMCSACAGTNNCQNLFICGGISDGLSDSRCHIGGACAGCPDCLNLTPLPPSPPIEICSGGADEDNNGKIDCEDPACLGTPECSGGGNHRPSGDLFPIIQCGYNCPGIFPGDPDADCCTLCDAFETISRIINIILMFGFILGGMFLVVAGIIMYAGGASSGLLNKSKTIIKGVIYGLVIMLVSYLIVFTIIHFLSAGNADTLFSIKDGGFVIECTP